MSDPSGSYRTRQYVVIETDPKIAANPVIYWSGEVGPIHQLGSDGQVINSAVGTTAGLTVRGSRDDNGNAIIEIGTSARNPLATIGGINVAPSIDNDFYMVAPPDGNSLNVVGKLDGFPSTKGTVTFETGPSRTFVADCTSS